MSAISGEPGTAAPPPSPGAAERAYALLYSGLFLALGAQIAFHQIWLREWGLGTAEIGFLNAAALGVRVIAGWWAPSLADRHGRAREVMVAAACLGALAAAAHLIADNRWQIYVLVLLMTAAYSALIPISDAQGYAAAERFGFTYRRPRAAGSFAFLCATFFVGVLVDGVGVALVVIWIAVAFMLGAFGASRAPLRPGMPDAAPAWSRSWRLIRDPEFRGVLICVALIQASHAIFYVYGSIHLHGLGYSDTVIGAIWSWGVIAEILLFFVGASWVARIGPRAALITAGLLAAMRWTVMATDPPLAVQFFAQTLHAASFAMTHLAALSVTSRAGGDSGGSTGQGVLSAFNNLAMIAATLLAAELYPALAGAAYLQGAAFAALGALLALRLRRTACDD